MKVAIVAGEASGDLLAAGLIREFKEREPGATFEGVAGPAMEAVGCQALEDAEALAVMGLIEPLKEVPRLLRLRRSLVRGWRADPPDVFIGVDAPDFNFGLEKQLRKAGIPTVHYVSPSVWAWRAGRVETVRAATDRLLCILPFEKALYDEQGIDAVYVGHPKADSIPVDIDVGSAREVLGLGDGPIVAILPGSRTSEVSRLGSLFAAAAAELAGRFEGIEFVAPAATPRLRELIDAQVSEAGIAERFRVTDGGSIEVMAAADVVLLASGTAALEAALLAKPVVAAYKVAATTAFLVRTFRLLKLERFTLPNLLTEEPLIPELIQEAATPTALADAVGELLEDPERRARIAARFAKLHEELALGADARAADAVIDLVQRQASKPG